MWRRGVVIVLSVVVVAWLGLMLRDTHYLNQGSVSSATDLHKLITELQAPGGVIRLGDDLRKAQLLNPDMTPKLALADNYILLAALPHQRDRQSIRNYADEALRLAQAVTRAEPDNSGAWIRVEEAQRERHDVAAQQAAAARIGKLDPFYLKPS